MSTILITGINGYLGSHLAEWFSKANKIIGTEISTSTLDRVKNKPYLIYGTTELEYQRLFQENEVDTIIHTATTYGKTQTDGEVLYSNLLSPLNLLGFAIARKCKCFINTDTSLNKYTSNYSLSKKQFREWLEFRSREIKVVNMQLEHFYGPGASDHNFIVNMIKKMRKNSQAIELTKGEQIRDFIYIDDVISAFDLVIMGCKSKKGFFQYEVGSGDGISIRDLLNLMRNLTNSSAELKFGAIPYRMNELMESKADVSNLKRMGWSPVIKIQEGLIRTINGIEQ